MDDTFIYMSDSKKRFGNYEKINGRTTSDISQQRFFSGDKGFEFSALTIRDIKWGKE